MCEKTQEILTVGELRQILKISTNTAYNLCYPQLVGTIQLSGGRRHVKKYIWSF